MKKLIFSLIATSFFVLTGNAQKMTNEEARVTASKLMIQFKNQLQPAYNTSKNFDEFEKTICGSWLPNISHEGNTLLKESYDFLSNKTTDETILKTYNGKGIIQVIKFQQDVLAKNPKSTGTEVFGGPGDGSTGDYNPYSQTLKSAPCRWWQLACWIDQIFGTGTAATVVPILINILLP
ncbi:hypothetical protein [Flavobacterium suncheonense]|uniref:hypothetical protein n=1 Tax=Flavobacterium suncheonense TaxID=350894 RepID=UPI003FA3C33A